MAYYRSDEEGVSLGCLGCGPGCPCAPCTQSRALGEWYVPDDDDDGEPAPPRPVATAAKLVPAQPGRMGLGDAGLGWTVRFLGAPPGHEKITLAALGPASTVSFSVAGRPVAVKLSPGDVAEIIRGNTDTDIKYFRRGAILPGAVSTFLPSDQRQHALRATYGQPQADALRDIVRELESQHAAILAERLPRKRLYRIGHATHLVQDSFSPAHTLRTGPSSCIAYIRNYGINPRGTDEHRVPKDPRDEVARSVAASTLAEKATRRYLQIVFKAVHGKTKPDPVASREAEAEFKGFLADIFRSCLSIGAPPAR